MKKLFIETEDYNALIITDGKQAVNVSEFPQDGTLDDATNWDCSGIEDLDVVEDVAMCIASDVFDFNESDFESVTEVGTL